MNLELLKDLRNKEITVTRNGDCFLYKWHRTKSQIRIDRKSIHFLISNGILEEDSGNFDTCETHYIINMSRLVVYIESKLDCEILYPLIEIIREIRINKVLL